MRLYRALLHLYPRSFRAEYGEELLTVLADRRTAAGGIGGRLALAAATVGDTIVNASRVHGEILVQDVRYAARTLRRSPAFTLTAVLLTALGIGATTAAFAVADHVLLRPLPYSEPDRLVRFWHQDKGSGGFNVFSPGNYRDLAARAASLESAAYTTQSANLVGAGAPVRLEGQRVTGELFGVLGRAAAIGRVLTGADALETSEPVVVLSHRAWRTHFGADPGIIHRSIVLNGTSHAVIGVMPDDFMFPDRQTEFWTALTFPPQVFNERDNTYLWTVARLRAGRTLAQADAELDTAAADLERQFPNENARMAVLTVGLRGNVTPASRTMIAGVAGAAVCLLLIACTNLAGLLLSRGLSRQREMAVRAAIGAGRERLVRQMITESFVVAIAGAILGAFVAVASVPLLAQLVPTSLPITEAPSADLRLVAMASALALITTIAFGVLPARRAAAGATPDALRETSRTGSGRMTERLRGGWSSPRWRCRSCCWCRWGCWAGRCGRCSHAIRVSAPPAC